MKTLYLVIGAIGSGKSTICNRIFLRNEYKDCIYISSDYFKMKFFDVAVQVVNKGYRAGDELSMKALDYYAKSENSNKDIIMEFCPMRHNKIKTITSIIEENHLNVVLIFINTENDLINIERKEQREKNGADIVPKSKVERSYSITLENVWMFIDVANKVYFIDNSEENAKIVGLISNRKFAIIDKKCQWINKMYNNIFR